MLGVALQLLCGVHAEYGEYGAHHGVYGEYGTEDPMRRIPPDHDYFNDHYDSCRSGPSCLPVSLLRGAMHVARHLEVCDLCDLVAFPEALM